MSLLESFQVSGDIIDKSDTVLFQRLPAGKAVRKVYYVVRSTESHHIKKVARKLYDLKALRKSRFRQFLRPALLGQKELVSQIFTWISSVKKSRL